MNFQILIFLFINEKIKVVGNSSNESSQESAFCSNISKSKIDQTSSQGCDGGQHGNHGENHQQENQSHDGGRTSPKGKGNYGGYGKSHQG